MSSFDNEGDGNMEKIRIGIVGYGNLGRGVELSLMQNPDMMLVAVFSRRDPHTLTLLTNGVPAVHIDEILNYKEKIDVMILCGGSATDLPTQSPEIAKHYNIIDSFDTHAHVNVHYARVDEMAKLGGKIGIISVGWDPGLFSLNRLYGEAVLPHGETYTFWGPGLSQGHSDAIRRVEGVLNGVQYTVPKETAVVKARLGEGADLTIRDKHLRQCYVVAEVDANTDKIEKTIKNMPNYFADYDTEVHFISAEELQDDHSKMPHGGFVIRSGETGKNLNKQVIEYQLKEESNPEFTSSVLVCYARAAYRLSQAGATGAKTVFDIAPALLSIKSNEQLRAEML